MAKQKLNDMLGDTAPSHGPDAEAPPHDELETRAPRTVYTTGKTYDASETMTPRLVLAQGQSPEVRERRAEVGDWLLMGHEPAKEVTLVLAGHAKKRRYVPANEVKAQCYSPDAEYGYGDPGTLPDGSHLACAECPLSQWTDSGKKGTDGKTINNPPPCSEIDEFIAFSVTHGMPVIWPLKGTAAKAARFIKTLSNGLGEGNFAITVGSEAKTKPGRAWSEPVVKIAPEVSRDEAQVYADIARGAAPVAPAALAAGK
jgi:hypothetical protein